MRVMGLDYGEKTVGVALSDELLLTAQPYETVVRDNPRQLRKTLQRLEAIVLVVLSHNSYPFFFIC